MSIRIVIGLAFTILSSNVMSASTYDIEKSMNDEIFIINDEKYEAQTYCFSMDEGDEVIFLEGSAYGACVTAKLYNIRSRQTCEVWCE